MIYLLWFVCGIAAAFVASSKGHSGCGFLLLGFLLGPIALAIALIMGKAATEPDPDDFRSCPRCAEQIRFEASVCRFCGTETLPPQVPDDPAADDSSRHLLIILCAVTVVFVIFMMGARA